MEIRIRDTGVVVTEQEFRAMFPNTGFPVQLTEAIINDFGGDVVFEGPQASNGDRYQFSMRQGVEEIQGKWYTKYVLGPVFTDYTDEEGVLHTAAEQEAAYKAQKDADQAKAVREQRTKKLAETDWVVIKAMETGTEVPADVAQERQWLRDITSQAGFPWDVKWSSKGE
jgi:hypothetical protein